MFEALKAAWRGIGAVFFATALASCSGSLFMEETPGFHQQAAPCDPGHPDGACRPGFVCAGGACRAECGGGLCAPGSECTQDGCEVTTCSTSNPYGACTVGLVCEGGLCAPEAPCGPAHQAGTCPQGEYCANGACTTLPPCSALSPAGSCPADNFCDGGFCTLFPCSGQHPSGSCVAGRSICVGGGCQVQPCSGSYPDGRCLHHDDVCNGGTCVRLPCSPDHPEGTCLIPGQVCVLGACGEPTCSVGEPNGTCGGVQVCIGDVSDPDFGSCQTPCDLDHFDGHCPPQDECVLGSCEFACQTGIRCGATQICCDPGFVCDSGSCVESCTGGDVECGQTCCTTGELCIFDTCVRDQGPCVEDAECEDDAYCDCLGGAPCNPAGSCLPYGLDPNHPPYNEDCANLLVVGVFAPGHQCEWSGPTDRVAHCGVCQNAPGDAKTCQNGLCVGCGADGDCSSGEICENGTCHTSCVASPTACAATETCRVVAPGTRLACYECIDTASDTDCYGGLTCVRGYCVDPYVNHTHVLSTPTVVDFDFDNNPATKHPSIVFVATDHAGGGGVDCQDSGVIRVLDGRDCHTQFVVNRRRDDLYGAGDLAPAARLGQFPDVRACNPVALADVDRTAPTRSEIVAHASTNGALSPDYGGLVTFRYQPAARSGRGAFELAWHSTNAAGTVWDNACSDAPVLWSGPSVFDLDGDGPPEALYGPYTYGADGRLLSVAGSGAVACQPYSQGIFPVVGDVDADGSVEWVDGAHVYGWNDVTNTWSPANEQTTAGNVGQVAIADFGTYTDGPPANNRTALDGLAEVAVVRSGTVYIQTIAGRRIRYPDAAGTNDFLVALGAGTGGPPTIADFDGDCRAEVAVASQNFFGVYDPDCDLETPDLVTCKGVSNVSTCPTFGQGFPKGVLFRISSQDNSSNVTGSSVFDFEGDGRAEAVYADECFTRVYDGRSGAVIYSQYHSSCTWYENPVIADVDGDFNAEVVVPSNTNCSIDCSGSTQAASGSDARQVDKQFAGLRCETDADCVGPPGSCACKYGADANGKCLAGSDPNDVELGLCTCTNDAQCGPSSAYFICADRKSDAEYNFLGVRKTCRAYRPGAFNGILVYRDILDRWVNTRRIWNQHVYSITHTDELGVATPAANKNWTVAGLNNFRQNTLTDVNPESSPDATVQPGIITCNATETGVEVTVSVHLCNRGTADIGPIPVGFYLGDPDAGGQLLCRVTPPTGFASGECGPVTCDVVSFAFSCPLTSDVYVRADDDPDGIGERECIENNNLGIVHP